MKKLMTAVAAAATSLFAFGAVGDFTRTGFEDSPYVAGDVLNTQLDDAGNSSSNPSDFIKVWEGYDAGTNASTVVKAYDNDAPDFGEEKPAGNNYLYVETDEAPVTRYVKQGAAAETIGSNGIYLDTLVKFTPMEADDASSLATTDGDKIAIALVWDETKGTTNFVVRAGYVEGSSITPTNYTMNAVAENFDYSAWRRLTVRTVANTGSSVAPVGFAIYIDGELLDYDVDQNAGDSTYETDIAGNSTIATYLYNSTKHAFVPSLVSGEYNTATTLASVGFKGTGCIDDIAFSETKPKGLPDEGILVTIESLEGVSSVTVTVGQQTIEGDNGVYTLPTGTDAFTLAVDWDEDNGYTSGTIMQGESSISEGTVNVSGGTTITLKGNRANFAFVDGNGDSVTASTLADALARVGNGETITLAYSYDVTTEGESKVYALSNKEVTLDLHGETITGGANSDEALFMVNEGATLTVIDTVGGGKIVDATTYAIFLVDGYAFIGSTEATDKGVTIDGILVSSDSGSEITIVRGNIDATKNSAEVGNFVAPGSACSADPVDGYWVVAPSAQPEPTKIDVPTAANNLVYDGTEQTGVAAGDGYTLSGDFKATNAGEYTAIATPATGYSWSDGSTEATNIVWSIAPKTDAEVVVTLTSEIAGYSAQLEFPTASATIGGGVVAGTPAWDPATITEPEAGATNTYTVTFTVTTPNYADSTGTATFKVWKAKSEEPEYPSYIGDDAAKKAYDAWAAYAEISSEAFPDAGGTNKDAYLLNCKPSEVEAAKAAFKFTSISYDATEQKWVTETTTSYNAREYNGTVTVKQYSDVGCTTESETGTFFRAVLQ